VLLYRKDNTCPVHAHCHLASAQVGVHENASEDSHVAHAHVASAQIGAGSLIPHLSTIQEEDEDPGHGYTLHLLIDALCPSPNEDVIADSDLSRFAGGRNEFESLSSPISFADAKAPPGDDSGVVRVIPFRHASKIVREQSGNVTSLQPRSEVDFNRHNYCFYDQCERKKHLILGHRWTSFVSP
jgi:hypothetical protein